MDKLVTVGAFQFVAEAELMLATLHEHGIPACLANEHIIAMDWLLSNAVGGVKLQVAQEHAAEAVQIVQEFQSKQQQRRQAAAATDPIVFECDNCRASIQFPGSRAGGVETCPRCGRYVDVPEVA